MRSFKMQVRAAVLLLAAIATAPAMGQTHTEVDDAGIFPTGDFIPAQKINGAVTAIEGHLDSADIDMYRLCLAGNQTFSASTSSVDGGVSGGVDTALFLFDLEGRAVYYNNNIDAGTTDSRLPAGHTLTPIVGGTYYLAISNETATPGSDSTDLFDQPQIGVGGPNSGAPVGYWSSFDFTGGDYRIVLTGTIAPDATCPDYSVSEFLPPINPLALNVVKAGATVAVKWILTDSNGNPVDDPSSFVSITSTAPEGASCAGLPPDAVEPTAGNSGLQYLGDGVWQFNWKVPKSYVDQCRIMTLTLSDGKQVFAYFEFE